MNVFEFGKIVTDLKPDEKKKNPRNSEGAFLKLKKNNIIFVYSRFRGDSAADFATSDLCQITFDTEMHLLDSRVILKCEEEEAINIMSVSLLRLNSDEIGLFYLIRKSKNDLKMYFRRSCDEGKTWGEKKLCTAGDEVFVVNNDRVVKLSNGRIIIPAAAHPITDNGYSGVAQMTFFYSDDNGLTWKEIRERIKLPEYSVCRSGLQEPGVIELGKGNLMGWARTDLGRQYQTFSEDYGITWTRCEPSNFTSPNSPLSMKKDRKGNLAAIWNPIPEYNGRNPVTKYFLGGRCPLVIAFSNDNGKTFSEPMVFESDLSRGYCYCSIYFTEEYMLLAYCAGGVEDKSCLARCRIRKVPLDTLEVAQNLLQKLRM